MPILYEQACRFSRHHGSSWAGQRYRRVSWLASGLEVLGLEQ